MKLPASLTRLLAVGLCFAGASAAHAQLKVGVVDMNKIFSGYYKTKDAETKINDAREVAKKELDERMESHKQLLDEINVLNKNIDNTALSPSAKADNSKKRDDKIQQVRSLENEINEFKSSRERQLQEQAVRMRNTIVEEIMAVINNKVKGESYDLIFDKSGQSLGGVPVVVHARDNMDFSEDVITALNKTRPATPSTAVATPAGATPAPAAPPKR